MKLGYRSKYIFYRIAAIITFGVLLSLSYFWLTPVHKASLSSELQETVYYYDSQSRELIQKIEDYQFSNVAEKKAIMQDVRNFNKDYPELQKELRLYPDDERVVNAFIDFHRSRTEFLSAVVNQLSSVNI